MTITPARLAGGSRPRPGIAEAISAAHLTKTYPRRGRGAVRALDDVSLTVPTGTILGLLGPNGAGKSTTVKILTTLAAADSGRAVVAGLDVAARPADVRRAIGYVPQKSSFDPMGTGRENLVLQGRVQGLSARQARIRAEHLLASFALTGAADRLVRTWSGGMARKLDVALGLVHRPAVLFLDEPTTGLDPQARAQMWAEITALAEREGLTILLTTHYLEEADRLAEHLVVIDAGRVVATGTPDELKSQLDGDTLSFDVAVGLDGEMDVEAGDRVRRVLAEQGIDLVSLDGVHVRARAGQAAARLPRLLAALAAAGVELASVTVARPSLDDVYPHYTGRRFGSAATPEAAK